MAIKITEQVAGSVSTPTSGKVQLFVDSTDSTLKIKDSTNTVTPVGSGGGGGGLVEDPTVRTSNFTATVGTAYRVSSTSGPITVTLPAGAADGDTVEIFGVDGGADVITVSPNGQSFVVGALSLGSSFLASFSASGCHLLWKYGTALGRWTCVSDAISTTFVGIDTVPTTPSLNSVIFTDDTVGQAYSLPLGANTVLGRKSGTLQAVPFTDLTGFRIALSTPFSITSSSLQNVTDFTWNLEGSTFYTFELYLPIKISSGSGVLGVSLSADNTPGVFSLSAAITSASTVTTNSHTATPGATLTGASQTSVSTFATKITGSIFTHSLGDTVVLQVQNTNTTDVSIAPGAWGVMNKL